MTQSLSKIIVSIVFLISYSFLVGCTNENAEFSGI